MTQEEDVYPAKICVKLMIREVENAELHVALRVAGIYLP